MKNFIKEKILKIIVIFTLILIGVGLRIFPHLPNFVPISAIALFGGCYFSKKIALLLPLTIMIISDIFIGYYEAGLMIAVYGSFFICVFLGFWLKKHKKWQTVLGASIICSFIFFIFIHA
jgi:hypothetical protein